MQTARRAICDCLYSTRGAFLCHTQGTTRSAGLPACAAQSSQHPTHARCSRGGPSAVGREGGSPGTWGWGLQLTPLAPCRRGSQAAAGEASGSGGGAGGQSLEVAMRSTCKRTGSREENSPGAPRNWGSTAGSRGSGPGSCRKRSGSLKNPGDKVSAFCGVSSGCNKGGLCACRTIQT